MNVLPSYRGEVSTVVGEKRFTVHVFQLHNSLEVLHAVSRVVRVPASKGGGWTTRLVDRNREPKVRDAVLRALGL